MCTLTHRISRSEDEASHQITKSDTKQDIIALSIKYSIVTPFTSFLAIEKRGDDEEQSHAIESITELIAAHDIDRLPYVGWEVEPEPAYGECDVM